MPWARLSNNAFGDIRQRFAFRDYNHVGAITRHAPATQRSRILQVQAIDIVVVRHPIPRSLKVVITLLRARAVNHDVISNLKASAPVVNVNNALAMRGVALW